MNRKLWLLMIVLITVGCLNAKDEQGTNQPIPQKPEGRVLNPPAYVSQSEEAKGGMRQANSPASSSEVLRKITKKGEIVIEVPDYDRFFEALQERIIRENGYVSNLRADRSGRIVSSAQLELKIPPDRLATLLSWLREQGSIRSERIFTEDITEKYYDLRARLVNARRLEGRLLEMLQTRTAGLGDVMQVESKLSQVREQIEQMEGKLRYFDAIVDMATLKLQVHTETISGSVRLPTFLERASRAWHGSLSALVTFGQAALIGLITLIPWIVPSVMILLVLRTLFRKAGVRAR